MGIVVALHHRTQYTYDCPISLGPQLIRLRPAPHARAHIQSYSLRVAPEQHFINWQQDPFGNYLARVVVPEKTTTFSIEVDLVSEVRVFNPFDFFLENEDSALPFVYQPALAEELAPYLALREHGPRLRERLAGVATHEQPLIDLLSRLTGDLSQQLKYLVRLEPGVQTCEQTLELGSGSCRDMAWLLCQMLRHLGFATRFASGYLIQLTPDTKSLDGPSGTDVDFTDLHAWTEVYLPGAGWIGLDPTSGLFTGEGHIPLCCTPDPSSAAPITGSIEGGAQSTLVHEMTVTRIQEERRITKPYTDADWLAIDALGEKVDRDLDAGDVRLTMGGEPTFVSLDDREGAEWNTAALGPLKWQRSNELLERLWGHFAAGGVLQHGQGKWYPGEPLPRWALGCTWREDGQPIWKDRTLLAVTAPQKAPADDDAQRFVKHLADALAVATDCVIPAYEDTTFYLWKEGKLPIEGDILKVDFFEKLERERLQRLLLKNINQPVGAVLPLAFSPERKRWISNRWRFRNERLVLAIGNSPIGMRLPMDSIPFVPAADADLCPPTSPFEDTGALPSRDALDTAVAARHKASGATKHGYLDADPTGYVRTALCAEVREGILHVFLPPIPRMEFFLDLVTSIESTAAKLGLPIRIEGYSPPFDLRTRIFKITPDPGVIEVNVHPARSWKEQVEITEVVYEQARQSRLATDKFLLDGRRIGTGGGNHIVVGGKTPADSPFLRRPDLLRSMITFWQHHPSLSYLFSSLYIGPTSQSPRIDEARLDSLYELEIAFQQIPAGKEMPLWLVDRLLRNLMIDVSGNTHRVEFCIDKLYSPDSETGRLGLLELRAFEMPPHPRMSLVQSLLVRACIATFWKTPYTGKLVRWGTRLHDQFMLPHFVWNDLKDVLDHLHRAGYPIKLEWFEPLFEFRFPKLGTVAVGDIELELRTALEPWPVMGEESNASGVSRGVDSSLERLQVKAHGLVQPHHVVTCNGQRVPLQALADGRAAVGGVRFKAWAPHSSLHPTLPADSPLVFDVVDTRYERSLGGCTYHVAHPGGVNYERVPINENEAEGRRLSRFQASGHTPGPCTVADLGPNPEFPLTLDLRLAAKPDNV